LFVAIDTFPCCSTFPSMFHNFLVVQLYPFFTFLFFLFKQVPTYFQPMITEMNSLIECDIDELSKAMAADYKVIMQGHMPELYGGDDS
jgi:hypothetical protein